MTGRKRKEKAILFIFLLFIFAVALSACAGNFQSERSDLTANDDQTIVLHGLSTEDIEISVADLKKLKSETVKATATRYGGEKIKVSETGTLLDTLLEKYGVRQSDFQVIRFIASDQYSIAVDQDILQKDKILLGYYDEGKPLSKENGPVRVVIPKQRAMYWVRKLQQIDFESEDSAEIPETVVFLESAASKLQKAPYTADETNDLAIRTSDLLATYGGNQDQNDSKKNVYLLAADGLLKNELKSNFTNAYIKITGENSPEFTSPQLPEGMQVKNLITAHWDKTAFFSMKSGLDSMDQMNLDDNTGIPLSAVIKKVGSMNCDRYCFTGLGGEQITLSFEELGNALLYLNPAGQVVFVPGISGVDTITGLLSITAAGKEE